MARVLTRRAKIYGAVTAAVIVIVSIIVLNYFNIINVPFLPWRSNDLSGPQPAEVLSDEEYAAATPGPTQDDLDRRSAMDALEAGSLADFLAHYDKIIDRNKDDVAAVVALYGERTAELTYGDAVAYKDQIIADATRMNELAPDSAAGPQAFVALYTALGDRGEVLHWSQVAKSRLVDSEERSGE